MKNDKTRKGGGQYPATEQEIANNQAWARSLDLEERSWVDIWGDAQKALRKVEEAEGNYRQWRAQYLRFLLMIGACLLRDREAMAKFREVCKDKGIRFDRNASVFAVIARALYGKDRANAYIDSMICREAVALGLTPEQLEERISEGTLVPTKMVAKFKAAYREGALIRPGTVQSEADSGDDELDESSKGDAVLVGEVEMDSFRTKGSMIEAKKGYHITGGMMHIAVPISDDEQVKLRRYATAKRTGIRLTIDLTDEVKPAIRKLKADKPDAEQVTPRRRRTRIDRPKRRRTADSSDASTRSEPTLRRRRSNW